MTHPNELIFKHSNCIAIIDPYAHQTKWYNYCEKHPDRCAKAMDFLENTDLKALPVGRHEIDGDNVFVNVSEYTTKPRSEQTLEAHKKYIDIQYVISGDEGMYLEPLENTEIVREYDEAKDVYFVKAKSTPFYLHADQYNFFVFFPEDAHGPGIEAGTLTPVKKAIVKIKIEG